MSIRHPFTDEGPLSWVVAASGAAASAAALAVFAIPASGTARYPDVDEALVRDVTGVDRREDPAWCPSLPSVEYVGAPWAVRVPGCPRLSRWWVHVDEADTRSGQDRTVRNGRNQQPAR